MTKAEWIRRTRQSTGMDHLKIAEVQAVLDAGLRELGTCLAAGDALSLVDFGSWKVVPREARSGRHPQTGAPMEIPATLQVKFKTASRLASRINSKSPAGSGSTGKRKTAAATAKAPGKSAKRAKRRSAAA